MPDRDPLDGLDDIDWAELSHAYGDAADVPELLRGLRSSDPAEREGALDALYGGVHHQGDVYDSTLACLPFLCALAADPTIGDRDGVLGLLDSIGGSADASTEYADEIPDPQAVIAEAKEEDDWYEEVGWAYGLLAHAALHDLLPTTVALLADPDPAVRAAAAGLLARRHPWPDAVLEPLLDQVAGEDDGAARHAHAEALGVLAQRLHEDPPLRLRGIRALARLAEPGGDPGTELAALAALARHAPDHLPAGTAEQATAALDRSRERPAAPAPEARPDTGTLLSHLRDLRASTFAEGADERVADALRDLHQALGDQVMVRHRLIVHALRHGDPQSPLEAVDRAGDLHSGWRLPAPAAAETAELLGRLLRDPDEELATAAARELCLGRLPLAPDLLDTAAAIAEEGRFHTDWGWERNLPGQCLQLLAAAGDERGAELLAPLLPGRPAPEDLPLWCEQLPPNVDLFAGVYVRMREVAGSCDATDEDGNPDHHALRELGRLLAATAAIDRPDARRMVGIMLAAALTITQDTTGKLHHGPAMALDRPGGLGPDLDPEDTVPLLRRLLADPDGGTRVNAARALWHGGQDPAVYLPVLAEVIADTEQWWDRFRALELVAVMGPAAAPLAERIHEALASAQDRTDDDQNLTRLLLAARATAPAAEPHDDLLRALWTRRRDLRPLIAAALLRERTTRAVPAGFPELIRAELADPRHVRNDSTSTSRMRYDTAADDAFRTGCRALLTEQQPT
ncbi:hypothetical protein [Streptomyces sp. NRRL WC-3742]|uniref:hypothetical protein n=1 Tax=Streptomyces sp. NRRL WC-3742 TaxID=1463934 RepID=UPI000691A2EE|nr:hypothetical protein [Streptomyces sp. NRRL WC-3742]